MSLLQHLKSCAGWPGEIATELSSDYVKTCLSSLCCAALFNMIVIIDMIYR